MSRFDASFDGIGEMLRSDFMEEAMRVRAEAVKEAAVAAAPFDPDSKDGTHYRDAFEVTTRRDGGYGNDRAAGIVSNDDGAALWIELGSRTIEARHVLGKALDAAGDL